MRKLNRHQIPLTASVSEITIPASAVLTRFGTIAGQGYLWTLSNANDTDLIPRRFRVLQTGAEIDDETLRYVGSCVHAGNSYLLFATDLPVEHRTASLDVESDEDFDEVDSGEDA